MAWNFCHTGFLVHSVTTLISNNKKISISDKFDLWQTTIVTGKCFGSIEFLIAKSQEKFLFFRIFWSSQLQSLANFSKLSSKNINLLWSVHQSKTIKFSSEIPIDWSWSLLFLLWGELEEHTVFIKPCKDFQLFPRCF